MQLKDARIGDVCVVEAMDLPFRLKHRLEALGMTLGTPVSVFNRKGKGIMIVRVRGTNFALGRNITANIKVRCAEGERKDA